MAADYGMRTSKVGVDAGIATGSDLIMSTRYPFAKIDQTKQDTFRTTTVTFLNDTPDNVKTLVASFTHGYTYKPQLWGLWNITWGPGIIGTPGLIQNGYGSITNSSGFPSSTLTYDWDATNVYLYLQKGSVVFAPSVAIGTIATLTTYIFVDDLSDQDYTV